MHLSDLTLHLPCGSLTCWDGNYQKTVVMCKTSQKMISGNNCINQVENTCGLYDQRP